MILRNIFGINEAEKGTKWSKEGKRQVVAKDKSWGGEGEETGKLGGTILHELVKMDRRKIEGSTKGAL